MQRFDLALIVGWGLFVVIIAAAVKLRKPYYALAGAVIFALALSALGMRENRQTLVPPPGNPYREANLDYALTILAKHLQDRAVPVPSQIKVESYASGFDFPVSMAWDKGTDDIYVTERDGRIRVLDGTELIEEPCARLPVKVVGENDGLLGIALSPTFQRDHFLYTYYTDVAKGENRVVRFSVTDDYRCTDETEIIGGIPVSDKEFKRHNGGQLEFLDGMLFVSTGEADDPHRAQDLSSLGGKILRLEPDGDLPGDNPFPEAGAVWAYGFRNPFGLAVRPRPGILYSVDNGPYCSDEINLVKPGTNYGWGPEVSAADCGGAGVGQDPVGPLATWEGTIAPTDPVLYEGRLGSMQGLLVGDFNFGFLHRFAVSDDGTKIGDERVYDLGDGSRIIDVDLGPGGWPYVVAVKPSGEPSGSILRLVPD